MLLSIYESKGEVEKQKDILEKCYKLSPKNTSVRVKLAEIYLKEGRTD